MSEGRETTSRECATNFASDQGTPVPHRLYLKEGYLEWSR
jgi:hypothetical protein